MPTFVYLPVRRLWLNMEYLDYVIDETPTVGTFAGQPILSLHGVGGEGAINLGDRDREVFLRALSKLTPKELT